MHLSLSVRSAYHIWDGPGTAFSSHHMLATIIDVDSSQRGLHYTFTVSLSSFFQQSCYQLGASWESSKTAFMALICWVLYGCVFS